MLQLRVWCLGYDTLLIFVYRFHFVKVHFLVILKILFKMSYFRKFVASQLSSRRWTQRHLHNMMTLTSTLLIVTQVVIYFETMKHFVRQRLIQCSNLPRLQAVEVVETHRWALLANYYQQTTSDIATNIGREAIPTNSRGKPPGH